MARRSRKRWMADVGPRSSKPVGSSVRFRDARVIFGRFPENRIPDRVFLSYPVHESICMRYLNARTTDRLSGWNVTA